MHVIQKQSATSESGRFSKHKEMEEAQEERIYMYTYDWFTLCAAETNTALLAIILD